MSGRPIFHERSDLALGHQPPVREGASEPCDLFPVARQRSYDFSKPILDVSLLPSGRPHRRCNAADL